MVNERLRAHCYVCVMSSVMLRSHDRKGLGCVCACSIPVGCARTGVTLAMGRVTDFNMAGSDDAASGQQVQRGSFLFVVRSAQR
jgi:hypothetical protein